MLVDQQIILYILAGATAILLVWAISQEVRLRRLLRGKHGRSLEEIINTLSEKSLEFDRAKDIIHGHIETLSNKTRQSVRGVGIVRFNAFSESGGNQSFAAAFLNEKGDGIIVSSLHSRERVATYAKPISDNASEYELLDEEKEAIRLAQEQHNI